MNTIQTHNPIHTDPSTHESGQLKDKLQHSLESGKQAAASCCESIRKESSHACESAADAIRKNPLEFVLGAAFVGAAVCYLILEGRSQPTFRDRYVSRPLSNARDSVSDSVGSAFNTLKFW